MSNSGAHSLSALAEIGVLMVTWAIPKEHPEENRGNRWSLISDVNFSSPRAHKRIGEIAVAIVRHTASYRRSIGREAASTRKTGAERPLRQRASRQQRPPSRLHDNV